MDTGRVRGLLGPRSSPNNSVFLERLAVSLLRARLLAASGISQTIAVWLQVFPCTERCIKPPIEYQASFVLVITPFLRQQAPHFTYDFSGRTCVSYLLRQRMRPANKQNPSTGFPADGL